MATMDKQEKQTLLIALGGNALVRKGQVGTIEEQFENLKVPIRQIARLSRQYKIIITHGNGPQVGNLLLQQESCTEDRIQFGHGTHGVGRLDQTALDHLD
jgi:carbamate kinase